MRTFVSFLLLIVFAGLLGAQPAPKPATDMIPANIAWFTSEADWISKTGVGAPKIADKPTQMWRDNAFTWGSWWTFNNGGSTTYKVLDEKLCAIDSPQFYSTYQVTIVKVYEEFAFLFPQGVPCLRTITIPNYQASALNFGGTTPITPYPIELRTDVVLLPANGGGGVTYQDYQTFMSQNKPKLATADQMIAVVKGILSSSQSAASMVQMIRLAVQNTPVPDPVI